MYDIFLTHAWRYHDDWSRFVALLDSMPSFEWRNFSLPWYDPAFDPRTPVGERLVMKSLEAQIAPAHCCILLSGVFQTGSARKWVDIELDLAKRHRKPVFAAPAHGSTEVPPEVARLADRVVPWDAGIVVSVIRECVTNPAS